MLPTFQVRGLRYCSTEASPSAEAETEWADVQLEDEAQYDELIKEHPETTLSYVDEDDGDIITVGSSVELLSRISEVHPITPVVFDLLVPESDPKYNAAIKQWTEIVRSQTMKKDKDKGKMKERPCLSSQQEEAGHSNPIARSGILVDVSENNASSISPQSFLGLFENELQKFLHTPTATAETMNNALNSARGTFASRMQHIALETAAAARNLAQATRDMDISELETAGSKFRELAETIGHIAVQGVGEVCATTEATRNEAGTVGRNVRDGVGESLGMVAKQAWKVASEVGHAGIELGKEMREVVEKGKGQETQAEKEVVEENEGMTAGNKFDAKKFQSSMDRINEMEASVRRLSLNTTRNGESSGTSTSNRHSVGPINIPASSDRELGDIDIDDAYDESSSSSDSEDSDVETQLHRIPGQWNIPSGHHPAGPRRRHSTYINHRRASDDEVPSMHGLHGLHWRRHCPSRRYPQGPHRMPPPPPPPPPPSHGHSHPAPPHYHPPHDLHSHHLPPPPPPPPPFDGFHPPCHVPPAPPHRQFSPSGPLRRLRPPPGPLHHQHPHHSWRPQPLKHSHSFAGALRPRPSPQRPSSFADISTSPAELSEKTVIDVAGHASEGTGKTKNETKDDQEKREEENSTNLSLLNQYMTGDVQRSDDPLEAPSPPTPLIRPTTSSSHSHPPLRETPAPSRPLPLHHVSSLQLFPMPTPEPPRLSVRASVPNFHTTPPLMQTSGETPADPFVTPPRRPSPLLPAPPPTASAAGEAPRPAPFTIPGEWPQAVVIPPPPPPAPMGAFGGSDGLRRANTTAGTTSSLMNVRRVDPFIEQIRRKRGAYEPYHQRRAPSPPPNPQTTTQTEIDLCVAQLIEMGYAEDGTQSNIERLKVYAQIADGNVEEAIEELEKERQAWGQRID